MTGRPPWLPDDERELLKLREHSRRVNAAADAEFRLIWGATEEAALLASQIDDPEVLHCLVALFAMSARQWWEDLEQLRAYLEEEREE